MESKILELTNILEEIASLLEAYNQQNWKEAVRAIKIKTSRFGYLRLKRLPWLFSRNGFIK